jgi:pimeloyl-ACP methyl ester carboxylesterase
MTTTSASQTIEGVRIHYVTTGQGSPLVLIHGYLVSHRSWELVLEMLAEDHLVVALDLPGSGESDRPADYPYTVHAFAHTVGGLLDGLGISRAAVMGHSMGGAVAMALAAGRPELVTRLVAASPVYYRIQFPLTGRIALLPVVGEILFKKLYRKRDMWKYFHNEVYVDPALPTQEMIDFYWERFDQPGGRDASYRALQHALAHVEALQGVAERIRCPLQLVWGEADRIVPRAHAQQLLKIVAGSNLAVIPGSGHAPQEERPREFCEAVRPFLGAG